MERGLINDLYPLVMSPDRVEFHAARPKWEKGRLESCAELMKPGHVIIDVGAECGDFTSLYRTWVGDMGTVIPVEPQPAYWPSIRQTWEANGFTEPPRAWFPGFAADFNSLDTFRDELETEHHWPADAWPPCSNGTIIPDFGFRHLAQQAADTPAVRMDTFCETAGISPDAIVFDIEGAEWHALVGCHGLMVGCRPLIWVSVHEPTMAAWYGKALADILDLAKAVDYTATELPHHGEGETFWLLAPA